mgnify:CR=1 FL=1
MLDSVCSVGLYVCVLLCCFFFVFFLFNDTATTDIYTE